MHVIIGTLTSILDSRIVLMPPDEETPYFCLYSAVEIAVFAASTIPEVMRELLYGKELKTCTFCSKFKIYKNDSF